MESLPNTILDTIGNTSLLQLRNVTPANGARIFVKLESQNPTGSMKDRMALAMIEAPERDGRLKPGGAVVEYTGGSTGVSLALVCSVKGHPLHTGANVTGALRLAERLGPDAAIVTIMCDTGMKYLKAFAQALD